MRLLIFVSLFFRIHAISSLAIPVWSLEGSDPVTYHAASDSFRIVPRSLTPEQEQWADYFVQALADIMQHKNNLQALECDPRSSPRLGDSMKKRFEVHVQAVTETLREIGEGYPKQAPLIFAKGAGLYPEAAAMIYEGLKSLDVLQQKEWEEHFVQALGRITKKTQYLQEMSCKPNIRLESLTAVQKDFKEELKLARGHLLALQQHYPEQAPSIFAKGAELFPDAADMIKNPYIDCEADR